MPTQPPSGEEKATVETHHFKYGWGEIQDQSLLPNTVLHAPKSPRNTYVTCTAQGQALASEMHRGHHRPQGAEPRSCYKEVAAVLQGLGQVGNARKTPPGLCPAPTVRPGWGSGADCTSQPGMGAELAPSPGDTVFLLSHHTSVSVHLLCVAEGTRHGNGSSTGDAVFYTEPASSHSVSKVNTKCSSKPWRENFQGRCPTAACFQAILPGLFLTAYVCALPQKRLHDPLLTARQWVTDPAAQ